jgi:hypothetical protein
LYDVEILFNERLGLDVAGSSLYNIVSGIERAGGF